MVTQYFFGQSMCIVKLLSYLFFFFTFYALHNNQICTESYSDSLDKINQLNFIVTNASHGVHMYFDVWILKIDLGIITTVIAAQLYLKVKIVFE